MIRRRLRDEDPEQIYGTSWEGFYSVLDRARELRLIDIQGIKGKIKAASKVWLR
jgi:hypothetical protein